jgi:hypothetical protein
MQIGMEKATSYDVAGGREKRGRRGTKRSMDEERTKSEKKERRREKIGKKRDKGTAKRSPER